MQSFISLLINTKDIIMKKKQKGFTLIELLVVVAIIGILAAVGVVAYSGYVAGAKKSASKSHQAQLVKLVAGELKKCDLGDTKAFAENLTCTERYTADKIDDALVTMMTGEFTNPYLKGEAISKAGKLTACSDTTMGSTQVQHKKNTTSNKYEVTITTCASDATADLVTNVIEVE